MKESLIECFDDQDFDEDVKELSDPDASDSEECEIPPSEDSANEKLVNDIGGLTKFNVFTETLTSDEYKLELDQEDH